jgi:hypothetical protein
MKDKFEPFHAQIDYETSIVDVQYEGKLLNPEEAIEYAKESYPSIKGEIIYNYPPEKNKGFDNLGVIGIK